jgi:lipoprotein signal peptidase
MFPKHQKSGMLKNAANKANKVTILAGAFGNGYDRWLHGGCSDARQSNL